MHVIATQNSQLRLRWFGATAPILPISTPPYSLPALIAGCDSKQGQSHRKPSLMGTWAGLARLLYHTHGRGPPAPIHPWRFLNRRYPPLPVLTSWSNVRTREPYISPSHWQGDSTTPSKPCVPAGASSVARHACRTPRYLHFQTHPHPSRASVSSLVSALVVGAS